MRPAGSSHIMDCAAWRYWRSRRMRGSALRAAFAELSRARSLIVRSSTARTTMEPECRMTSRRARTPPGSSTSSVVTLNTGPWKRMLEERTRPCFSFVPADFAMTTILRYAAPVSRKPITEKTTGRTKMTRKTTTGNPSIAIVGAGSLATFLAVALHDAGFPITEIVARDSPRSRQRARALAAKVGAQPVTAHSAALGATLLWLCVPDREIRRAAWVLSDHLVARALLQQKVTARFALHSSGALSSRELDPLRKAGAAVASAHPLMTFVAGAHPSLTGVPFAIEGDDAAMRVARRIVRELGGESFSLPAARKAAYHAW